MRVVLVEISGVDTRVEPKRQTVEGVFVGQWVPVQLRRIWAVVIGDC